MIEEIFPRQRHPQTGSLPRRDDASGPASALRPLPMVASEIPGENLMILGTFTRLLTRELTMTENFDLTRPDMNAVDPKEAAKADKEMHERRKRATRVRFQHRIWSSATQPAKWKSDARDNESDL